MVGSRGGGEGVRWWGHVVVGHVVGGHVVVVGVRWRGVSGGGVT